MTAHTPTPGAVSMTSATVRRLAAEAVRHVDQWVHRGITDLSVEQIEALVIVAAFALPVIGVKQEGERG